VSVATPGLTIEQRRSLRDELCCWLGLLADKASASRRAVAKMLGMAESTLRDWVRRGCQLVAGIVMRTPGRPCRDADRTTHHDILCVIHETAGKISIAELKKAYPDVGRRYLKSLRKRYRRVRAKRTRRGLCTLSWQQPGTVWAMDFTQIKGGVEDAGKYLLNVRDLASGASLCPTMCLSEGSVTVRLVLEHLFAEYGEPLVLKCDNGSGFIAEATKRMLAARGVLPLYSPPGLPQYNGSCEAGCGSLKMRAQALAQSRAGAAAPITLDDLEAARQQANMQPVARRAGSPTRHAVWSARARVCPLLRRDLGRRAAKWEERLRMDKGIAPDVVLPHAEQASLDRFAIGKSLRELNLLMIRRR
jgi:putative transposase